MLNSESVINQDYLQNITYVFNLHNVECNYCIENVPNDLNAPFTIEEVSNYISKLPNDGLVNEMFTFPESWCKSIIQPLLNKRDPRNVNNYKGISLLLVISKIVTGILNKRL